MDSWLPPLQLALSSRRCLLFSCCLAPFVPMSFFQDRTIWLVCDAKAMLLALFPHALETPAILPCEGAEAMLLVFRILTLKRAAIRPAVATAAMDYSLTPHAFELSTILSHVMSTAIDGISLPLSSIHGVVRPIVNAMPLLLSPMELAAVLRATFPLLNAFAMLHVLHPLTSVCRQALLVVVGA
eukprot:CAMPEP_0197658078 /NCGR_PEP_ID=MMETSP1338-20131121/45017_1 /TAXON_ID=43686 ORGANISM="Pelagodinium beii, Strain RCC1491" /NCGR_SAMPLE_ID=MMETSP1338 /ASSEMBLY_ACC=CAM_ASM_000754 /LENGTH=183 /DNA_ID=CAMNT_0043234585 /DNA_START=75 /DNA_END=626 /DNA_ORIENTATION=-